MTVINATLNRPPQKKKIEHGRPDACNCVDQGVIYLKRTYPIFNEVFFSHCTNSLTVENLEKWKDIKIHLQTYHLANFQYFFFFLKEKIFPHMQGLKYNSNYLLKFKNKIDINNN